MSRKYKDCQPDYHQSVLYPTNVFDLLPVGEECFLFQNRQLRHTGNLASRQTRHRNVIQPGSSCKHRPIIFELEA